MHRSFALGLLLFACHAALAAAAGPLDAAEQDFLEFLDARDAVAYLDSGHVASYEGRDADDWDERLRARHAALLASLDALDLEELGAADRAAVAAMRVTLADFGDPSPAVANDPDNPGCDDRHDRSLDYEGLSAALSGCFREIGNNLKFEDGTVDRGGALGLFYEIEKPERRKALFDAFLPLWQALNGANEPDSPYRRLIRMAAAAEPTHGSGARAAARAIGVTVDEVERWLVKILETWRDANPPELVEPWDYRYAIGEGSRRLASRFADRNVVEVSERYYADLGVDLDALGVVYDIKDRPNKSPLAYCDFLKRGRYVDGEWRPTIARIVGRYEEGGVSALNELVHEQGHAVHISAIRNRPAYTDWTDTLFTEAFADVPSWSVFEPAWQKKYLGTELPAGDSLRGLFGSVMLDVAWSLYEIRMLRDPAQDPNAVWTGLTHEYLRIRPHPEVPWWAMRVQLASRPGYMVNYGLGAVLTAEIRKATADAIGPFDAGNPKWHAWTSETLLRFGSEKTAKQLMDELLGRPLGVEAVLSEIRRIDDSISSAADPRATATPPARALGLFPAEDFEIRQGREAKGQAPAAALWYFDEELIAVPREGVPATGRDAASCAAPQVDGSTVDAARWSRPPLVWLTAPQLLESARLEAPDRVTLADGTTIGFDVVPPIPTNTAYLDDSTRDFWSGRALRLRGTMQETATGRRFVARAVWPEDARIDAGFLDRRALAKEETIADLVRAQPPDWPGARLLWAREGATPESWVGRPAIAIVLSGAQGDSPGSEAGHIAVATGRFGPGGEWSDWLAYNIYPVDEIGDKAILSAPVPMDVYLADLNSGQALYRPVYAFAAVLDDASAAVAVQSSLQHVHLRYWCHDLEFHRARHNSTEMSIDGLRAAGWRVSRVGGTNWFQGLFASIGTFLYTFDPRRAREVWNYFTEERTDLLPVVAFETALEDLLALAEIERAPQSPLEQRLQRDLRAVLFLRFPQIPSSRPFGTYPVRSVGEYRARVSLADARSDADEDAERRREFPEALRNACRSELPPACLGEPANPAR